MLDENEDEGDDDDEEDEEEDDDDGNDEDDNDKVQKNETISKDVPSKKRSAEATESSSKQPKRKCVSFKNLWILFIYTNKI